LPILFFPFPLHLPLLSLLSFFLKLLFYFGLDENNREGGGGCLVYCFFHCCNKKKVPNAWWDTLGVIFIYVSLLCLDDKNKWQTIGTWGEW